MRAIARAIFPRVMNRHIRPVVIDDFLDPIFCGDIVGIGTRTQVRRWCGTRLLSTGRLDRRNRNLLYDPDSVVGASTTISRVRKRVVPIDATSNSGQRPDRLRRNKSPTPRPNFQTKPGRLVPRRYLKPSAIGTNSSIVFT